MVGDQIIKMTIKLDKIDRKILNELQRDANCSVDDISKRVGLSRTPCWRRVKKLDEAGILSRRVTLLDPSLAGFQVTVFAQVSIRMSDADTMTRFEQEVHQIPQVLECYSVSGEKDYMLKVIAEDVPTYERFLKTQLIHLPGVSAIDTIMALSTVKSTTELPL